MSEVNRVSAVDTFNGDNKHLISCIKSLLSLDEKGALAPHGVGGHARGMLSSAAQRLAYFDRVTAERDAALGRELQSRTDLAKSLADHFRKNSEISALQQSLTAADERTDVLESLLRDMRKLPQKRIAAFIADIIDLLDKPKAALKPAEVAKCCTVSPEDQALLDAGDYTPEELFGVGGKPSCLKCAL